METGTPGASGDIAATTGSSQTASPAVTTESAAHAAPATQGTDATPITDTSVGEPPKERWADILENTRTKTRAEALAEWRQQYGWAESVPREQLEQMASWYARYQGDPGDFLEKAYQEALSHPVHGATVKSRIGRMLASLRAQPAEPDPTFEPDVPVMNEQGQIVSRTYSADLVKQMLAHEIGKAVQPLKQDYETRQTEAQKTREREQIRAQADAQADADVAYVTKRPFFAKHKAEILKVFRENPAMTLREAADHVLDTTVLPGVDQKAQADVVSTFQQKAHAQTVHPGAPSGTAKPKFKTFDEAATYYEQHPEEAAAMAQR